MEKETLHQALAAVVAGKGAVALGEASQYAAQARNNFYNRKITHLLLSPLAILACLRGPDPIFWRDFPTGHCDRGAGPD